MPNFYPTNVNVRLQIEFIGKKLIKEKTKKEVI